MVEILAKENTPVQHHIGLIPTFSHWCGGLRAWGRTTDEAMEIYRTLKRMDSAGVFVVEVECIAEEVLRAVNEKTSIVTFSLGSGNAGDAVFLFMADICGEASEGDSPPKHAHAFGNLSRLHKQMYEERVAALKAFHGEVTARNFPYPEQSITMHPDEDEQFLELVVVVLLVLAVCLCLCFCGVALVYILGREPPSRREHLTSHEHGRGDHQLSA